MTKILLLAGYPGTGKSYLAQQIIANDPDSLYLGLDTIKEDLYDLGGFHNQQEKQQIDYLARMFFYQMIPIYQHRSGLIILDYPFGQKHYPHLQGLAKTFNIFTIRLTGDLSTIYQRKVARKNDLKRHQGHKAIVYYGPNDSRNQYDQESYDQFRQKCQSEGYNEFVFNQTMVIDTTNFNDLSIAEVVKFIQEQT